MKECKGTWKQLQTLNSEPYAVGHVSVSVVAVLFSAELKARRHHVRPSWVSAVPCFVRPCLGAAFSGYTMDRPAAGQWMTAFCRPLDDVEFRVSGPGKCDICLEMP